jgi:vitamin B12 transporter
MKISAKRYRLILLAGVIANSTSAAFASEQQESVMVTGSYTPVQSGSLSSSHTVLTAEFLRATNMRSVADALRTVPGLLIEASGGQGGLTAVSIRGGEANFTLVLVDGVEVNDPTNTRGGSFDFSNLDIASVERIEIVRGPESAVYGSDAMAGVINVITKRPTEQHEQRAKAEWGEDDFERYSIGATGTLGKFGYSAQFAQWDSGEPTEGSERENDEANLGLHWSPSNAHHLQLNYRYLDGNSKTFPEQSGGAEFAVSRKLNHTDFTDETVGVSWGWKILPDWHSELSISRFDHDEDYRSPGIFPFSEVPPQQSQTNFTRDQYRWVNSVTVLETVHVAAGADYRNEEGDSTGELDFGFVSLPTDFSLDRSSSGVFLDVHSRVLPALLLQAIVRYDEPDDFSSQTTLKVGSEYNLTSMMSLSANWGEAFKLPSFFALGHGLVGNPDLQPETAESWDVGVSFSPSDKFSLETAYFSNVYKDLIDFDSELFINVNRRQVDTSGVELQLNWTPTTSLNILGHATYTDIDVKDEGAPLLGRPEWTAGATALWQISANWHVALDYQWTGEQYASSRYTGSTVIETLDDFNQLDMSLAWQILDWAAVEVAFDNVLDEDFQTAVGFSSPGRSVRLAVTLSN